MSNCVVTAVFVGGLAPSGASTLLGSAMTKVHMRSSRALNLNDKNDEWDTIITFEFIGNMMTLISISSHAFGGWSKISVHNRQLFWGI